MPCEENGDFHDTFGKSYKRFNDFIVLETMDEDENHVEIGPYPGWLRVEVEGKRPFYKSPFPRTVLGNAGKLREYLAKEKSAGRMLDVEESLFSFKRKFGLKTKPGVAPTEHNRVGKETTENLGSSESQAAPLTNRAVVDLLTRDPDKTTDHRKLLSQMSKLLDDFQPKDVYQNPPSFDSVKKRVEDAFDMKDIHACLLENKEGVDAHTALFSDICLSEISRINLNRCPLVEFPSSINENLYCKIVEYGMATCPQLISFIINMVVRKGDPVLPRDVLKIATMFSDVCYTVNNKLDAVVKIRSLGLQLDGLSNLGLDTLSDLGLTQCSRSLSNHRDLFADVGREVMDNTLARFPYQSILGKSSKPSPTHQELFKGSHSRGLRFGM